MLHTRKLNIIHMGLLAGLCKYTSLHGKALSLEISHLLNTVYCIFENTGFF
jgi:hypothetical protein